MKSIIHRAALLCIPLVFGVFAAPAAAQQAVPDQPPPTTQTAPAVPPAPPPDQQIAPEAPPPFPPMPARAPRHRWVDVNDHRTAHAHHRASHAQHHRATHAHRRATRVHHPLTHPSKRLIHRCRSMSHRQMLRSSACKALMRPSHDETKHDRHHRVARHRAVDRPVHRHHRR